MKGLVSEKLCLNIVVGLYILLQESIFKQSLCVLTVPFQVLRQQTMPRELPEGARVAIPADGSDLWTKAGGQPGFDEVEMQRETDCHTVEREWSVLGVGQAQRKRRDVTGVNGKRFWDDWLKSHEFV